MWENKVTLVDWLRMLPDIRCQEIMELRLRSSKGRKVCLTNTQKVLLLENKGNRHAFSDTEDLSG